MGSKRRPEAGTTTAGATETDALGARPEPRVPGLVFAWKPRELVADDRAPLGQELVVGRGADCGWCIPDSMLSRAHLSLRPVPGGGPRGALAVLRDLGSRNGVFVGGRRVAELEGVPVSPGDVIRAGRGVFVVVADLSGLGKPSDPGDPAMAGRFHTAAILHVLRVAARTGRHLLLEGESGAGKELAAGRLHQLLAEQGRAGELVTHNAACFAGEDDAVGTLFGVRRGAFTGVVDRAGALELAEGGTLFLDEVHNLPLRVQRSLLRFAEDGLLAPLGSATAARRVDVRLILGTNAAVEAACDDGRLARDLMARLHRVSIPPLRERRADIPDIFQRVLHRSLPAEVAEAVLGHLGSALVERLCLHDYRWGNVRELEELAAVVGARLAEGEPPDRALRETVDALIGPGPGAPADAAATPSRSNYEARRAEIVAAYAEAGGNLKQLEATLRARGFDCNRRWLAIFLERWGIREIRKRG